MNIMNTKNLSSINLIRALFLGISLIVTPPSVMADFIDNGTYIYDTSTGLDWYKLTNTVNQSYDSVSQKLSTTLTDWQFATSSQVANLFSEFGLPQENLQPIDSRIASYDSKIVEFASIFEPGYGYFGGFYGKKINNLAYLALAIPDWAIESSTVGDTRYADLVYEGTGSFLVRNDVASVAAVPAPSAVWLFASGLLGLFGLKRRGYAV